MFEQCIKTLLNNCSVSPLKADGYHEKDKRKYGKRKLKETNDVAECSLKKVLKLDQNVDLSEDLEILNENDIFKKTMKKLKKKFNISEKSERVQILTIFVNNMKRKDIEINFEASRRLIDKAIVTRQLKRILGVSDRRKGKTLVSETKKSYRILFRKCI